MTELYFLVILKENMDFPSYYSSYIYLLLPVLLFSILFSLRKGLPSTFNTKALVTNRLISLFIVLWSGSMFYLSAIGFFASSKLPTGPMATGSYVLIGLLAYYLLPPFKKYILSIPLRWLIFPQIFRILGGIFIFVTLDGFLPRYWGYTVGFGDFLTGVLAIPVLWSVINSTKNWRKYVIFWSIFGLTDIVHAIVVATIMTPSPFQIFFPHPGVETTNFYPLVLIVVIARPMVVLIHLFILFKLFSIPKNKKST